MANHRRGELEGNAAVIANWLVDHRAEFESEGVDEEALISSVGISDINTGKIALDQLENHEVVVRDPVALTRPPKFTVKPGRDWPEASSKLLAKRTAG